jgi:hypothetical protein
MRRRKETGMNDGVIRKKTTSGRGKCGIRH